MKLSDSNVILGYWDNGQLTKLAYKYFTKENEWFLCEFDDKKTSQCLNKGKGFPEGFPLIENPPEKDLTDLTEIIERSNEIIRSMVFV